MPKWKDEIRQRLASLKLEPTREAAIIEELAQHLATAMRNGSPAAQRKRKLVNEHSPN